MTLEAFPPLRVRESDSNPNVIPVYEMAFSGATVSRIGPAAVQILMDSGGSSSVIYAQSENTYVVISLNTNLTAERSLGVGRGLGLADSGANAAVTLYLSTPVSVSSGGTGVSTIASNNLVYGGGTTPLVSMATLHSGSLVVGSGLNLPPHIFGVGSQGQLLSSDSSVLGALKWINSAAIPGAAGVIYAQSENSYVVIGANTNLSAERVLTASTGLTLTDGGAGNSVLHSVNTNIRDKIFTFFAPQALSTTMMAEEIRIRIPYNVEPIRCDIAVTGTPLVSGITCDLIEFTHPDSSGATIFSTSANKPMLWANSSRGGTTTFDTTVLYGGSWLGMRILQVGSATAQGSNLTLTLVARTS